MVHQVHQARVVLVEAQAHQELLQAQVLVVHPLPQAHQENQQLQALAVQVEPQEVQERAHHLVQQEKLPNILEHHHLL